MAFQLILCVHCKNFSLQHFERQVEALKEKVEDQTKLYEQLESQNVELNDKCSQLQIDNKTLSNKNKRFWETIESLEKRCESYRFKIEDLENAKIEKNYYDEQSELNVTKESSESIANVPDVASLNCSWDFEDKIDKLQETIKELRVQQGIDNIERDELKAEIEDISTENQLLQHQVSSLESEIEDWKRVCEKAYKYKKLAEKYNSEFDEKDPKKCLMTSERASKLKSSSHEVLNKEPLCGPSDLLAVKQRFLSSSVTHLHQPPKNLSVLSEMDSQYHDLVKRYENLLNKYHQDYSSVQDEKRTTKVQQAIQTLSWDFTTIEFESNLQKEQDDDVKNVIDGSRCRHCEETELEDEMIIDYRQLFIDIFAKLRESKVFDAENSTS